MATRALLPTPHPHCRANSVFLRASARLDARSRRVSHSTDAFSDALRLYRDRGMWRKALALVREIRDSGIPLDSKIHGAIVDTLGRCGELEAMAGAFEAMQREGVRPDLEAWNAVIRWNCRKGDAGEAVRMLGRMMREAGMYPDPKVMVLVVERLAEEGRWEEIRDVFELMKRSGFRRSGAVYAVLAEIYGQYGVLRDARDCVRALKDEGVELSASVFCALANAYAQQGLCEQTVKVFRLMEAEGIEPNLKMLNLLMNAFGVAGRHLEAVTIFEHIKESGITPDVVTYTILMKAFLRARKFEQVPKIFREMERAGCIPDRKAMALLEAASVTLKQRGSG